MADLDYALAGAGGGLRGLIEAYKMKMEREAEMAKVRQSGFNQAMAPRQEDALGLERLALSQREAAERERHNKAMEAAAGKNRAPEDAEVVELGGMEYLRRRGQGGQYIYSPRKGLGPSSDELAGNLASLEQAPEYAATLSGLGKEGSLVGNLKRMASQTPIIGGLAGAVSPAVAASQEKEGAFITPYLQSGAGKAMTEPEKAVFKGRVRQRALVGSRGSAKEGLADLVKEILGKTQAGIGSLSAGPETENLRVRLQRAIEANRRAGLIGPELPAPSFAPGPTLPPAADVEDLLERYGAPE